MNAATLNRPAAVAAHPAHAHHWIIEEAHGPESEAFCKGCGATRQFRNWLSETDFVMSEERRAAS